MKLVAVSAALFAFAVAPAVFIENFDGNRLGDQWDVDSHKGNWWDATVSGGQLHVNGFYPRDWNDITM